MFDYQSIQQKQSFLYPRSSYNGNLTPQNLLLNSNLQEFAQRIGYISALQTGGKLTVDLAYQEIESLWNQLKQCRDSLINYPTNLEEE